MARWARNTRVTAEMHWRDRSQRGLSQSRRNFAGYVQGVKADAMGATASLGAAMQGNAAVAAAGMGMAIVSFVGSSMRSFADMEYRAQQMFNMMRNESQATKDAILKDLQDVAVGAGQTVAATIDTAYQIRSGGAAPERVAELTRLAMEGAAAGSSRGQEQQVATLLMSTLNAFNLEAENGRRVMDTYLNVVENGYTTLGQLATVQGRVNVVYADLGATLPDVASHMAYLTQQTGNAAEASTALRSMAVELSREESKVNKFFKEASGETFPEYVARTNDMTGGLVRLGDAARTQGKSLIDVFSSAEAGAAAAKLATDDFAKSYDDFMAGIPGKTTAGWGAVEQTTQHKMNQMSSGWENFKNKVGGFFAAQYEMAEANMDRWFNNSQQARARELKEENRRYQDMMAIRRSWVDSLDLDLRRERNTWAAHYTALAKMDWQFQMQRMIGLGRRLARRDPFTQGATFDAPTRLELSAGYLGIDPAWSGGIAPEQAGGGGRTDTTLSDIAISNREILESLRSGQALVVQLDAHVDEGIILRADTVQRASTQIAARLGNVMSERTRSG